MGTSMKGLLIGLFVALVAGCTSMPATVAPARVADGRWVDTAGETLDTFDHDATGGGKSMCNGPCATSWPPLAAAADVKASGDRGVIKRDDGSRQWAYKGKPLFTWIKDQKPGDTTGDGFNNAWRIARP